MLPGGEAHEKLHKVKKCMRELTCLLTDDDYSKCAWYVVRCVSKHVVGTLSVGKASCLYDLVVDVAINIAYHRTSFKEYDYDKIIWNALACYGEQRTNKKTNDDTKKG